MSPEFQTLVRMAAERQGQTVGSFVVETLRERATAIIKGDGEGIVARGTPPARIEDMADTLTSQMMQLFAKLAQQQTERLATIERESRRGRWRR